MTGMSKNKSKTSKPGSGHPPSVADRPSNRQASEYIVCAILVLSCFVLFLPIFVSYSYYYPYIFLKSILFRIAAEVMAFLYLILALTYPEYRPRFHRLIVSLLAWFGVMVLCSLPGISA